MCELKLERQGALGPLASIDYVLFVESVLDNPERTILMRTKGGVLRKWARF